MRRGSVWAWLWIILGAIYFFLPLIATFDFSLRAVKDRLSFEAYKNVFADPQFYRAFGFSLQMAVLTILISLLLVVPAAYWVHLRLRQLRPVLEFITLMPFVVPAVVLAFGLLRLYCCGLIVLVGSPGLLVAGYVVLSLPYMFRAVDTGLRAIDVRTLTEAAQSLGAGWPTILFRVIFPNLRVALLSGAFLAFAIVMGEFTLGSLLAWPAFGPYMEFQGAMRAYEPAALAILSFAMTWAAIGIIQLSARGAPGQAQLGGAR
jgi:putative spermidine/putrescine transport system permease protein